MGPITTKIGQKASGERTLPLSTKRIGLLIKEKMRKSRSLMAMFEDFEVDPQRLDDLKIIITNLDSKYAETDGETMKLDPSLFQDSNFFEDKFFIVAHEIVHWLSRVKEQDAYFNDPEEVMGFVASIAYEIEQHGDFDVVWNKVYPKISWHFSNESDAREFFMNMTEKAKKFLN